MIGEIAAETTPDGINLVKTTVTTGMPSVDIIVGATATRTLGGIVEKMTTRPAGLAREVEAMETAARLAGQPKVERPEIVGPAATNNYDSR